jgi:glucosylceramidase
MLNKQNAISPDTTTSVTESNNDTFAKKTLTEVEVWMSNVKQDDSGMDFKLSPMDSASFSDDDVVNPYTLYVDEAITDQTMDGFGASLTDSSSWLMYEHLRGDLNKDVEYNDLMEKLFDKELGIGLSFLRHPMSSTDYALTWYSYDDMDGNLTDPDLDNFSINHDLTYIIPCLIDAIQKGNGRIKIMASPWSPPGWMKNNDNNLSGTGDATLNPLFYESFANYFVKFIQAYEQQGIPMYAITLQNEPGYATPNYPSMKMEPDVQADIIANYLSPRLSENNISSLIQCYDHNWDQPGSWYVKGVYSNTNAYAALSGSAWHWYGNDYTEAYDIHYGYPEKGMWMTEGSTSGDWHPCFQWREGFINEMECLINFTRIGCKSIVFWNIALDQNRGPNLIDDDCRGLVMINSNTGEVVYNTDYYSMGHFSKFIDPGAVRIYTSEFSKDLDAVAFKNPDNTKVLVAFNVSPIDKTIKVRWGNKSFIYSIPGETAVTFRWDGEQEDTTIKNAGLRLDANCYSDRYGTVRPALCNDNDVHNGSADGECIGYISSGDYTVYTNMDFGEGMNEFVARVAAESSGFISIFLDSPTGQRIGVLSVPPTGGYQEWQTLRCNIGNITGVHDICLVFGTSASYNIHWFYFENSDNPPPEPGNNLVINPSFELDEQETEDPTGWDKWHDGFASYVEDKNPHSGFYNLAHWNENAYEVATYQDLEGIDNGLYTLKAWVRSSGGQYDAYMSVKNYGDIELKAGIPTTGMDNDYVQISINDIPVTTGECSITFYSNANSENWINVDDVEFYQQ